MAARQAMGGAVLGGSRSRTAWVQPASVSAFEARVRTGVAGRLMLPNAVGTAMLRPAVQALGQVQV